MNSNPQVTGNPRDTEKSSGELDVADNPEAGVMSYGNGSSELENTGDPQVVVMSDDTGTDGAGVCDAATSLRQIQTDFTVLSMAIKLTRLTKIRKYQG